MSATAFAADIIAADILAPASQRFATAEASEVPDFQRHVVPLLGRLGCNGRSCHGSFQGQGDFRLSLFGYDFKMDHDGIKANAAWRKGPRIDVRNPNNSLILQKPLQQVDHEGGARFSLGSWEHHLLHRWIKAGAKGVGQPRELARLEVEPREVVFDAQQKDAQLRVIAVWQSGQREDVTPLCRFRTNDDSVVTIDSNGRLQSQGAGDSHVIAFYDNGVGAVPVLRPLDSGKRPSAAVLPANSVIDSGGIDSFIQAKLDKLGIVAAPSCSDTEFLRRVSIDLTGTLPTPGEIEAFLSDADSNKRNRKIDELLQRPAYAAWWANKLCDFTGCNPNQQAELGQETSAQWYMWIYARLRENMPYDELVERIVLATSRRPGQSYDDYAAEVSGYFRDRAPNDFSQRESMPHYWTRRSMQKPAEAAQAFAHNFLGIRLQCAQCHKHPFASWTQDDFQQFSHFFDTLNFGVPPSSQSRYRELAREVGLSVRDHQKGAAVRSDVLRQAQKGRTIPWREIYVQPRDETQTLRLLRSETVSLAGADDPRQPIMRWMKEPGNPWFARAFVNRVWASYFHVGIIDPPDDLNPANPPSHPDLLNWLAEGFVRQNYDMKWLHRQITSSQTYQRSWRPNETNRDDRHNFSRAIPRRMPAEVVYDSVKQAVAANDQLAQVRTDLTRRAIGHLSMRLAGTYAMQVFGKPDRAVNCDCERVNQPTLLQAVFLQNDPIIEQRLEQSGWLADIAAGEATEFDVDQQSLVRQAWLRTLSRPPNQDESARALDHFKQTDSTVEGLRDLLWALLNTKEFVLIQ
ncbi:MAG: DUF1549 and DUF1553 domain-containing protein [Pirellulales bacterium]|nr:DUF1549 and DUF1553 domain-containing protein [Pirellulales bacterium]